MYVIEDRANGGKIVACGTLFLELKFIHAGGWCGHIEDVVVDANARGRGLGKLIVTTLKQAAEGFGCYKVRDKFNVMLPVLACVRMRG